MNDMRGGELVKPKMTFGKGMAEGCRGERRGTGEQLVCACVSVCVFPWFDVNDGPVTPGS